MGFDEYRKYISKLKIDLIQLKNQILWHFGMFSESILAAKI